MQKRILSALTASLYFFFTGPAYALIPLIPGVVPLATYLGAGATLATAIDYSLVLHAGILAIALNRDSGAASSSTSSQLTVMLNPKEPLPTPTGWTAPVAPSIKATPPSTMTTTADSVPTASGGVCGIPKNTPTRLESQPNSIKVVAAGDTSRDSFISQGFDLQPGDCGNTFGVGINYILSKASIYNPCPAGYTSSGSSCNLTNPSAVSQPSNSNCQIVRTGNAYSQLDNDPDCATSSPTLSGATITPSTITMTRADGSFAQVTINSDGTTTSTESYPDIANSKTNTFTSNFSAPNPSTGEVTLTGISTGSAAGVGTAQQGPQNNGNSQIVVDKLNAQDAAAAAAASANGTLPTDPASVSALALPTANPYSSALPTEILGFKLPTGDGSCVGLDANLTYFGNMHIEPCGVVNAVRPMVNFLIIALATIGGVLVWLRSDGD